MTSRALHATTVLVTGGAGGLGKAIATAYLEQGANVAVCARNEDRLNAVRQEFESTGRFLALKADITNETAVQSLVAEIVSKFGRLDILVNNAGMIDRFDPVGELSKENWDKILGVNLTGSFLCMKTAVQQMQKQQQQEPAPARRGGTIIQIGSGSSTLGFCSGAAYTVSKHGVAALVKNTAGFYGDEGIYAVGVMLGGMVDTNIREGLVALGGPNREAYAKVSATNKFKMEDAVRLQDVAKYCVFLADKNIAASLNGSCVPFSKNWPKA